MAKEKGRVKETKAKAAENGDIVKVNYVGSFESGDVFDTSYEERAKNSGIFNPQRKYEPLTLKVGAGQVIKGFDEALVGMKKGEKKRVVIPPDMGYGEDRAELIQRLPIEMLLSNNITPEVGMHIGTKFGVARITKVEGSEVELNFNHPLAGKTIVFEITLEDFAE